jgi:hypothetical protein
VTRRPGVDCDKGPDFKLLAPPLLLPLLAVVLVVALERLRVGTGLLLVIEVAVAVVPSRLRAAAAAFALYVLARKRFIDVKGMSAV